MRTTMRAAAGLAAVAALALLQACASAPRSGEGLPWTSGRLSLRVDASAAQAARSLEVGFDLRGDGVQGELHLATPLGTRLASARWSRDEAVLDVGRSEQRYPDLESLSRAALGEALPLRALPDWLAGRPWSGAKAHRLPDGFEQLGWQVSLARFDEGRIEALREQPPRVQVRVRLESAG